MIHRLRSKLNYANVVASLALFIALGGSAYAIGAGAIGSREIRDNSIRSRDVRKNALTGADINELALRPSPRVYTQAGNTSITLGAPNNGLTVSCRPNDTAVGGSIYVDGSPLTYRTVGTLTGVGRTATGYAATVYSEPAAVGQRRFLSVRTVCLAAGRR